MTSPSARLSSKCQFHRLPLPCGETIALETRCIESDQTNTWILFLHGLGSHRSGDKALFLEETLSREGFGFARFDFRGHGESDGRMEDVSLSRMLEDVRAVLDALEQGCTDQSVHDIVLVGSSVGGLVSAWYNALDPDRVRGQVLIAPAFRLIERFLDTMDRTSRQRFEDGGFYRVDREELGFDLSWQSIVDAGNYPSQDLPPSTRIPTLILHGTEDDVVPFEESRQFVRDCTSVSPRLLPILGGDHSLADFKILIGREIRRFCGS